MVKQAIKIIGISFVVFWIISAGIFFMRAHQLVNPETPESKNITVGGIVVSVEIADTVPLQMKGLSNRKSLAENNGMLFVYQDEIIRDFWMKDMEIPLDVIWIAEGVVVGFQENIPYQSDDGSVVRFKSDKPADQVLEVNAGWIDKNNIETGNTVDIKED